MISSLSVNRHWAIAWLILYFLPSVPLILQCFHVLNIARAEVSLNVSAVSSVWCFKYTAYYAVVPATLTARLLPSRLLEVQASVASKLRGTQLGTRRAKWQESGEDCKPGTSSLVFWTPVVRNGCWDGGTYHNHGKKGHYNLFGDPERKKALDRYRCKVEWNIKIYLE